MSWLFFSPLLFSSESPIKMIVSMRVPWVQFTPFRSRSLGCRLERVSLNRLFKG